MSKYRKVHTQIWNDAKVRTFSDDGKLVFLFVLTHPNMTGLGAMRATVPGLAAELGWLPERLREGLGEAFAKGCLEIDEEACYLALPNFHKHNKPESPNVVRSWAKVLPDIPECKLKTLLIQRVMALGEELGKGFLKAFQEVFGKPSRSLTDTLLKGYALSGAGTGTGSTPLVDSKKSTKERLLKSENQKPGSYPDWFEEVWKVRRWSPESRAATRNHRSTRWIRLNRLKGSESVGRKGAPGALQPGAQRGTGYCVGWWGFFLDLSGGPVV